MITSRLAEPALRSSVSSRRIVAAPRVWRGASCLPKPVHRDVVCTDGMVRAGNLSDRAGPILILVQRTATKRDRRRRFRVSAAPATCNGSQIPARLLLFGDGDGDGSRRRHPSAVLQRSRRFILASSRPGKGKGVERAAAAEQHVLPP